MSAKAAGEIHPVKMAEIYYFRLRRGSIAVVERILREAEPDSQTMTYWTVVLATLRLRFAVNGR